MANQHTRLLDDVLAKDSDKLDPTVKAVLHALRQEAQEVRLLLLASEARMSQNEKRSERMEAAYTEHVKSCNATNEQLRLLIGIAQGIQGTMTFGYWFKRFLAYLSSVTIAGYAIWEIYEKVSKR